MSRRTAKAYVYWIKRFILFHNKIHPSQRGAEAISAFLTYLATDQRVAASTQNQVLNALVFLYQQVLKQPPGDFTQFVRAKRPKHLPVVLTREEVEKVLAELEGLYRLMAGLRYGAGLRVLECVRLRIKDIDFRYGQILVRDAKGEKDRVTVLPENLAALHAFFRYVHCEQPDHLLQCQKILALPQRRHARPTVGYLSKEELAEILTQPDLTTLEGRRDAVLLSVLYDTGARVQQLIDLSAGDVRLDPPPQLRLMGKGRKMRAVPLMAKTVQLLRDHMQENHLDRPEQFDQPLFGNGRDQVGRRNLKNKFLY